MSDDAPPLAPAIASSPTSTPAPPILQTRPQQLVQSIQPVTKFHFVNPNGVPIPDEAYFENRSQQPQFLQQELLWAEQQLAALQKYVDTLRMLNSKNGEKSDSLPNAQLPSPNGESVIELSRPANMDPALSLPLPPVPQPQPQTLPLIMVPAPPPPQEEPIFSKETSTNGRHEYSSEEKIKFYMAFDNKDPAVFESVRAFCRRHNVHHSTARSWLRQRKELGAAAYGKTRRISKKLGRPPKSSEG